MAVAIKHFALDTVVWLPWEVLWMSPLADVLLFTAAGIGIAGLGVALAEMDIAEVVLVLMSAAASFVVLLHVSSLAQWARVLLTLGIGTQLGRWLAARPTRVARLAAWPFRHRATPQTTPTAADSLDLPMSINRRALLVGTAGTVAGLAAGLHGGRWFSERKQLSRLAPMQKPPNVLFIVLDTVRAMSMSLHGNARRTTPELEKLAARGVLFERAIATAPWTLPSHASMFTGLYPRANGLRLVRTVGQPAARAFRSFQPTRLRDGRFRGQHFVLQPRVRPAPRVRPLRRLPARCRATCSGLRHRPQGDR